MNTFLLSEEDIIKVSIQSADAIGPADIATIAIAVVAAIASAIVTIVTIFNYCYQKTHNKSDVVMQISSAHRNIFDNILSNDMLRKFYVLDGRGLTEEEIIEANKIIATYFINHIYTQYHYHENKQLSYEFWEILKNDIMHTMEDAKIKDRWNVIKYEYSEEFRLFMQDAINKCIKDHYTSKNGHFLNRKRKIKNNESITINHPQVTVNVYKCPKSKKHKLK